MDGYFTASHSTFMPLQIFEVHFDCSGLRKLLGPSGCSPRLRSRCGAVHIVHIFTFRGRRKGTLVFSWSEVDSEW